MKIAVLISTVNRYISLLNCLDTIFGSDLTGLKINVLVVVDGNKELQEKINNLPVQVGFNETRQDYVISMNKGLRILKRENPDAVLYASDDLEFNQGTLRLVARSLESQFPDWDGVVGLGQESAWPGSKEAFCLVGKKFLDRFPEWQLFCPDYIHYGADTEVREFAETVGKFYFNEEARVRHYRLKDATFTLANEVRGGDMSTRRVRQAKGLKWGNSWERVKA